MEVSRVKMIIVYSPDVFSLRVLHQVVFPNNEYIAVVTGDNNYSVEGLNSWLQQPNDLYHCIEYLISSINVPQDSRSVVKSIHSLLDNNPWSNEYYVMETIVIVPKSQLVNDIVELYGALLRARTWNNSSIYCVTCEEDDSTISNTSITFKDLSTSLPAFIGPMDDLITLSRNIIWKGSILIPEYKTESCPNPPSLVLHGLQISMDTTYPIELCQEFGMEFGHTHQPSHLELVKIVDVIDVPSVLFSPLTVTLSIDPSFEHYPSANVLKQLFFSATQCTSSAILVRLFMRSSNEFQTQQYTTDKWHVHILEEELTNDVQLSSCSPGPLLLILPSNSKSCDARLLWKKDITLTTGMYERILQTLETKTRKNKGKMSPDWMEERKESVSLDNSNMELSNVTEDKRMTLSPVSEDEGVCSNSDNSIVIDKSSRKIDVVSTRDAKKLLEKSIVHILRKNGLTKRHRQFRKIYIGLFKICKVYIMDLHLISLPNLKKKNTRNSEGQYSTDD